MSRSRRHTPICGWTTCRSEKDDKRLDHRLQRARVRNLLAHDRWDDAAVDGVGLSLWKRGKDGRQWFAPRLTVHQGPYGEEVARDRAAWYLRLMRK